MLDRISPGHNWAQRLIELSQRFPESDLITLEAAGFPTSWNDLALWCYAPSK
jgi:hypothetical protein